MFFTLEYLRSILPPPPPEEYVPTAVREAISLGAIASQQDDPELINLSARWTYAIFNELREGQAQFSIKTPPPSPFRFSRTFGNLSVGALDQEFETAAFGLAVQGLAEKSSVIGEVHFPRLNRTFPLALRALVEDPHAPPSSTNASSACWAEDRKQRGVWGFVTCRHALTNLTAGNPVPLKGGGSGQVGRKAPPTVDAAFVIVGAPPTGVSPLQTTTFATSGQRVDIHTGQGAAQRSVVSITDTLGVINDPYHPIKVYLDQPCQPGDSGSLVALPSATGIGVYCGSLSGATVGGQTNQTVGFAQHLEQAVQILDLDPYH
jgi:hypothetical protein